MPITDETPNDVVSTAADPALNAKYIKISVPNFNNADGVTAPQLTSYLRLGAVEDPKKAGKAGTAPKVTPIFPENSTEPSTFQAVVGLVWGPAGSGVYGTGSNTGLLGQNYGQPGAGYIDPDTGGLQVTNNPLTGALAGTSTVWADPGTSTGGTASDATAQSVAIQSLQSDLTMQFAYNIAIMYTGTTAKPLSSSGPPFYQYLVGAGVDPTGEDLASLVTGFADDARPRNFAPVLGKWPPGQADWGVTLPTSVMTTQAGAWNSSSVPGGKAVGNPSWSQRTPFQQPNTNLPQFSEFNPDSTTGWPLPAGAEMTPSRLTLVGPAINYPSTATITNTGALKRPPTDPYEPTGGRALPGYTGDFPYLDYRAVESSILHTKGGWRDHTDGNRITTTRGDKVEVIRGNYKLIVLGRQDQAKSAVAGMDISGGVTDATPGGLAATAATDYTTLTAITEVKMSPDGQYRSWSTTKKGTGTPKLNADGITVTLPAQGVTYNETWGWKTFNFTGVETQAILSGGSGPPVGISAVGGYAQITADGTGKPIWAGGTYNTGASGVVAPTGSVVGTTLSATEFQTGGPSDDSTAYQLKTGGVNPTSVGYLWPAYANYTENHVVYQASITAQDTSITATLGQIRTTHLLEPVVTNAGFNLTQDPYIVPPLLPGDITNNQGSVGNAVSDPQFPHPDGTTGTIGIPQPGPAIPAAFVGQENFLQDMRPYGSGYQWWPQITPLLDSTGAVKKNRDGSTPSTPALDPISNFITVTAGEDIRNQVYLANMLPKVRSSSAETHAMQSRTWSFVDSSFTHTEVTGLTNDTGAAATLTGVKSGFAGSLAATYLAQMDFPAMGGSNAPFNQGLFDDADPGKVSTWSDEIENIATFGIATYLQSTLFFVGSPPSYAAQKAADLAQGKTLDGGGGGAAQFTETFVAGNSIAHTEVVGLSHTLTHTGSTNTESVVDGTQHARNQAQTNITENIYGSQQTTNWIGTTQETTTYVSGSSTTNTMAIDTVSMAYVQNSATSMSWTTLSLALKATLLDLNITTALHLGMNIGAAADMVIGPHTQMKIPAETKTTLTMTEMNMLHTALSGGGKVKVAGGSDVTVTALKITT